jgi:hypothetical protein
VGLVGGDVPFVGLKQGVVLLRGLLIWTLLRHSSVLTSSIHIFRTKRNAEWRNIGANVPCSPIVNAKI